MKAKKTTKKTTTKRATTSVASRGRGVRILFATDGSPGAAAALDLLATLRLRAADEVTVVMYPAYFLAARPDGTGLIGRLMEGRRKAAQSTVDAAVRRLSGLKVRVRGVVAQGLEAADGILRVVTERSPDLIVMGSRGLGPVGSTVIGSTARTLALLSPVPVLIVRDRRTAPRRVLIAVDGSPASRAALAAFTRIPLPSGVEVELLHVLPAHDWSGLPVRGEELAELREEQERAESEAADRLLQASADALGAGVAVRKAKERGAVPDTIRAHADAMDADLVVLGSRGLSGPRRPFWGSTAERLIVTADCSVLLAPVPTGT
jgi:nucleotide-binding universal stress UspA family protein